MGTKRPIDAILSEHEDERLDWHNMPDHVATGVRAALDLGDKAIELLSLAVKMREAQKEYFKTRRGDVLADSKRLERDFDKAADAYFNPPTPDLFDAH